MKNYRPHLPIRFQHSKYLVKTAENWNEVEQALELRHLVFHREWGKTNLESDYELYDDDSDHLIIIDTEKNSVVGNYRIRSNIANKHYYCESEFDARPLLNSLNPTDSKKVAIELGRACIHPEYRKGAVILLLWQGIQAYAEQLRADILFGCSSVQVKPGESIQPLLLWLEKKEVYHTEIECSPLKSYPKTCMLDDGNVLPPSIAIPPLFQMYLKLGAKILGEPSYDPQFHCVDFLTWFDIRKLANTRFTQRPLQDREPEARRLAV